MGRSILAVAVGFVVIGALAMGTDVLVKQAFPHLYDANGRTESVPLLLFTLGYVGLYATFGCWLAARLAPDRPMRHALILGLLGLVFNVAGTAAMWNTAPAWYHVVALGTVMLWAWLGGRLREVQLGRGAAGTAGSPAA